MNEHKIYLANFSCIGLRRLIIRSDVVVLYNVIAIYNYGIADLP